MSPGSRRQRRSPAITPLSRAPAGGAHPKEPSAQPVVATLHGIVTAILGRGPASSAAANIGLVAPSRPVTALLERELRAYYAAASPPARAVRVVREGGMGSLAIKTAGELGYRRLLVLEHDLSEREASGEAAVDAELGELSDTREYRSLRPEQSVESVNARLDAGGTCFCARLAGRPVSITWAYSGWGPVPYLWSELESDADSILLQDTFTAPDLRGRGISPALARLIVSWARRRGRRRLLAGVLPENQASLRARRKAGFRVIATARCIGRGRRAGRLVHGMPLTFPQEGR